MKNQSGCLNSGNVAGIIVLVILAGMVYAVYYQESVRYQHEVEIKQHNIAVSNKNITDTLEKMKRDSLTK